MPQVPPGVSKASLTTLSTTILLLDQQILLVLAITTLVFVQVPLLAPLLAPLLVPVSVRELVLLCFLDKLSADSTLAVELRMPYPVRVCMTAIQNLPHDTDYLQLVTLLVLVLAITVKTSLFQPVLVPILQLPSTLLQPALLPGLKRTLSVVLTLVVLLRMP